MSHRKYIKYKTKNLNLNLKSNVVIHICGPSGSGKTTLGNKLKNIFNNKIVVKDIDDLRTEFIIKYYGNKRWTTINKKAYQQYINKYISSQTKPLIFVGLNNMPWWHTNHYYNMHSDYNYYIELDDDTILKQKCSRLFKDLIMDEDAFGYLINDNERFVRLRKLAIEGECSKTKIIKMNEKWNNDYKKQNYTFASRESIFKIVSKLLNKILKK
jgi:energy-coupling factor transporter ATP-binding protein EcfA2